MDDSIKVEIEIVHFLAIRIRLCCINGVLDAIDFVWLFFNNRRYDLRVFLGEPSKKRWNTHDEPDLCRDEDISKGIRLES